MSTPAAYCYRLYVGESTPAVVLSILNARDFNATVYAPASGLWHHAIEPCTVAEIIRDVPDDDLIRALASDLASTFDQGCVLVTRSDIEFMELVKQD
jgi:hypothetical protein